MNLQKNPLTRSIACYFCNELFQDAFLQNHMQQCGQILEPCRYKCGVYVPRRTREQHAQECSAAKRHHHRLSAATLPANFNTKTISSNNNVICSQTKADLDRIEMLLLHQQKIYYNSNMEISNLKKNNFEYLEQLKVIENTISTIQLFQNDIAQKYQSEKQKNQLEFEKFQLKHNLFDEHLKQLKLNIDRVVATIKNNTNYEHVENELVAINKNCKLYETTITSIKDDFIGFKEYFSREHFLLNDICNERLNELKQIKNNIADIDLDLKDVMLYEHANKCQTKMNKQSIVGNTERIAILEHDFNLLRTNVNQLQHDFNDLITNNNFYPIVHSTNGYILWKINNISTKLIDAKENDTIIRSPLFLNTPYGYKLRADMYLNGIGRWKDRHLIMTIRVLQSEWDSLLEWPCNLFATIVLKDQNNNKNECIDLVKTLQVKCKLTTDDVTENSCQHLFISHKTLLNERNYIKDDSVFIEIKIKTDSNK